MFVAVLTTIGFVKTLALLIVLRTVRTCPGYSTALIMTGVYGFCNVSTCTSVVLGDAKMELGCAITLLVYSDCKVKKRSEVFAMGVLRTVRYVWDRTSRLNCGFIV